MEYTKSEAKLWAKKNIKGLEVPIFPSFTPDLEKLDEDGIRLMSIRFTPMDLPQ